MIPSIAILLLAPIASIAQTVVDLQRAILDTAAGKNAAASLRAKYAPAEDDLKARQAEIDSDRARLDRESRRRSAWWPWRHALRPKQKAQMEEAIREKIIARKRKEADDRAALDRDRIPIVNELSDRMQRLFTTYQQDHGNLTVRQINPQEQPAAGATDITDEIVKLYDQTWPVKP
ncbi:MAG TPA: OmpH family outer membrane protein [Bryobacteraceae bacterium]|nr:OmpH family outer membrane protein [Bryobacteraceae bacterium]